MASVSPFFFLAGTLEVEMEISGFEARFLGTPPSRVENGSFDEIPQPRRRKSTANNRKQADKIGF